MAANCASFIPTPGWSLVSASALICFANTVAAYHAAHCDGGNIAQPASAGFAMRIGWARSLINLVKELPLDDGFGF
jgi:hypothetical protein